MGLRVQLLLVHIKGSKLRLFRVRCSGHVPVGGGPGADTGHTEEIISLSWPGNALASPRQAGVGGRGKFMMLPPRPGSR